MILVELGCFEFDREDFTSWRDFPDQADVTGIMAAIANNVLRSKIEVKKKSVHKPIWTETKESIRVLTVGEKEILLAHLIFENEELWTKIQALRAKEWAKEKFEDGCG